MKYWSYTVCKKDKRRQHEHHDHNPPTSKKCKDVLKDLYLCREATEEAEPEVHHGEGKVLVEEVAEEAAHAQVGPAAMHQQEALQEAELGKGVVTGQHGLYPLLTWDTNSDMSTWGIGENEKEMSLLRGNKSFNISTQFAHVSSRYAKLR